MATAEAVLAVARSQLGTREAADGANPYGRAYGVDRVAWCAQFLWWCFTRADAVALLGGKTAYTPTLADQFRRAGRFDTVPRVGDIAFFDWPDSVRRIQHVGLVEAIEPGAIVTIEGNTQSGTTGDQSDGGGVWRRRRARNAAVVGYGHPAYSPAVRPSPTPRSAEEDDMLPEDRQLLREVHAKLHGAHGTRVDFGLLGEARNDGYRDDIGGYAINADARAYEARQLALQIRRDVQELLALAKAQPLPAELDAVEVDGAALLTADDIRTLIREALADLGPFHLTAKEATP